MEIKRPLVEDQSYLKQFWHPICTLDELASSNDEGVGPIGRTLLDVNVVIAKLDGKVVAMEDRCAHRFSKLSAGKVVNGNVLQCPYHGWQYGEDGVVSRIPACPNDKIPKKAKSTSFECEVKYDIVWVRLDGSWGCTEIPYCSAWENAEFKRIIVAEPYSWNSSAERRWENFTDFSHFAYVHPGTLYDPAYSEPAIVPIDRVDGELRFFLEPGKEVVDKLPPESPLGSWTYRATMPFTIDLGIRLYRNDEPFFALDHI